MLAFLVWSASGHAATARIAGIDVAAAEAAARAAVREVFGADAEVVLGASVLTLAPGAGALVVAVPEPASRTGGPVRFVLYGDLDHTQRIGRLTTRVDVRVAHVRARARIGARVRPQPAELETVRDDIGRQPLAPLPALDLVTTATTRKSLWPGEVITQVALVLPALVTSGQEVVTVARVGGLEVRGRAIAAQSGQFGDSVIVVNPDSRRRLRARVTGEALVEVALGS